MVHGDGGVEVGYAAGVAVERGQRDQVSRSGSGGGYLMSGGFACAARALSKRCAGRCRSMAFGPSARFVAVFW